MGAKYGPRQHGSCGLWPYRLGIVATPPPMLPANWSLIDGYLTGPDGYLNDAALGHAHLAGLDLAGATLTGAHLTGADLSAADLAGADLPARARSWPAPGRPIRSG